MHTALQIVAGRISLNQIVKSNTYLARFFKHLQNQPVGLQVPHCHPPFVICHLFRSTANLKHLFTLILFLTIFCQGHAQYQVIYKTEDNDTVMLQKKAALQTGFLSRNEANLYISQLPSILQAKGFVAASVDSVQYDSLTAI